MVLLKCQRSISWNVSILESEIEMGRSLEKFGVKKKPALKHGVISRNAEVMRFIGDDSE